MDRDDMSILNWVYGFFATNKFVYALGMAVLSFFLPIYTLIAWAFVFIMADAITGCMASLKEGCHLQSKKFWKTLTKFGFVAIMIVAAEAIDRSMLIFIPHLYLANLFSALVCGVELYSILENAYRITGHRVFKILTQFTVKKIKDTTDIDISKE